METGACGASGACAAGHVGPVPDSDNANVTIHRKLPHFNETLKPEGILSKLGRCFMLSQTVGPSSSVQPTLTSSSSPGYQLSSSSTWRCLELDLRSSACKTDALAEPNQGWTVP